MRYVRAEMRLFSFGVRFILILGTFLVFLSNAKANGLSCEKLFEPSVFRAKPDRLYDYYQQQISLLSQDEVASLNRSFVKSVSEYVPPDNDKRSQTLDQVRAQKILDLVFDHPTIGFKADDIYSQPGEEMGYCFGRAMYMHLIALKLGVQKESIKKIWAVGPMQSDKPGVEWGYHVALMVYTKQGWIVLDPNLRRVFSVNDWVQYYEAKNLDGRGRFYATDPEKFGLYSGKYSRYLLGLDLSPDQDWFKHYFVDMMQAIRTENLSKLGLTKISVKEGMVSGSKPISRIILDLIGF